MGKMRRGTSRAAEDLSYDSRKYHIGDALADRRESGREEPERAWKKLDGILEKKTAHGGGVNCNFDNEKTFTLSHIFDRKEIKIPITRLTHIEFSSRTGGINEY